LRADPRITSLRNELALTDVRLVEAVKAKDWEGVERLVDLRRKLAATEARTEALHETTMTAEEALLLAGALADSLRRHVTDQAVLRAVLSDIGRMLGRPFTDTPGSIPTRADRNS
jgi:hypothetical protein